MIYPLETPQVCLEEAEQESMLIQGQPLIL